MLLACLMIFMVTGTAFGAETTGLPEGGEPTETITVSVQGTSDYEAAKQVLKMVNEEREKAGLVPLVFDSKLQQAALTRALEIVTFFNHTRPDGTSCITAHPDMAGENIAVGYNGPEQVMAGWMASPGHKANILRESYTSVGIGCIYYNGVWYWAQSFGRTAGDEKAKSGTGIEGASINMLLGLISPVYSGKTTIDLGDKDSLSDLRAEVSGKNTKWTYGRFVLGNELFHFSSSDNSVLQVEADGKMVALKPGIVTVTAVLKADPTRIINQEIKVEYNLHPESMKLSKNSYTYDGKAKKPQVTIEGLTADEDFTVAYRNNVKAGTAKVIVTGIGHVQGTAEKTFKIAYKKPVKVTQVKATQGKSAASQKKQKITVKWKKVQCDGYQIRYGTSKSLKTYKTVYVKKGTDISKTLTNLTKGKTYYIKVRAYDIHDGVKTYGYFSDVQKVKCK